MEAGKGASPEVRAYILAGGSSMRLGTDKRLIEYDGRTLLETAIALAKQVTNPEPVLVGGNLSIEMRSGLEVIPDARLHCGPLGGLVAALQHNALPWTLVLPVDMLFLRAKSLLNLQQFLDETVDALLLEDSEGKPSPLPAIYRTATLPLWRQALEENRLALYTTLATITTSRFTPYYGYMELFNLNTIEDLEGL